MKNTFLISLFFLFGTITFGQKTAIATIVLQTSAQCGQCKERIEGKLNYTKGIKFAELDLENKKVTIKYTTSKISALEIKALIASIGYDADDVKAKKEDVLKLPLCCQPGGMER